MQISDKDIMNICSSTIYKRGLEYFKNGRVHIKSREENSITAIVDDDEIYSVRIDFKDSKISNTLCTCPYFTTMGTNCKHTIATLKKRQCELTKSSAFSDDNDRIAHELCMEFVNNTSKKEQLKLSYSLYITTNQQKDVSYMLELRCGFLEALPISGIDRFIDSYINNTEFKLSKHTSISKNKYTLLENDEKIINILCEAYENKILQGSYVNRVAHTQLSHSSVKRLMPYLIKADCSFYINSMQLNDLRVFEDNPDILIDISATYEEIGLNIFDSGLALFSDGSWFLFEGALYKTSKEWREWFMPIYNAISKESRTSLDFKGNSRIDFATYVYPKLKGKQGVSADTIDSIVIDEKPSFSIYFDYADKKVSSVIKATYGSTVIMLPAKVVDDKKIIIRDINAEDRVLSYFSKFNRDNNTYITSDDEIIFELLNKSLKELNQISEVYTTDSFNALLNGEIDFLANATYKKDIDLLEISFESVLSADEIYEILQAVKLKKPFYRLKNETFLTLDDEGISKFRLLENFNFTQKDIENGGKTLSKYHLLYLDALKNIGVINTDDEFDEFVKKIRSIRANIPKHLKGVLRSYQKDGVNWLKQLSELGFGGVLADDMGLGKTLEVIAFVMSEKRNLPVLVVAPSALIYNWFNEINKFTPEANAVIVDGTVENRDMILSDIRGFDFVITSYALLRRDYDKYEKLEFSYMFIDESQHIKNYNTMNAKVVKKINAKKKFALSGTPIENKLSELWSVFDFVMSGYLPSRKKFCDLYEKPGVESTAIEELQNKVSPFILRRLKSDVLEELPEKIENTVFATMLPHQKKMYEAYLMAARDEVISYDFSKGETMQILTLLLRLRQICCYPGLFDGAYKEDSGKLILLDELVESAISQGHRILIFSQFTSMLSVIGERLNKNGYSYLYIDGKVRAEERTQIADKFNNGEGDILLISLKAGGTGLNLTGADTVILYDPWWNPAVMEQAADRAYRIGQTKAVNVLRLAAKDTIEEKILLLQESKKKLAASVIKKNEKTISGLTKQEILSLFE